MAKKYLSLEEAARLLQLEPVEVNRLREKGEVRAFADRGSWKFREEDVAELIRRRQGDSDPDVQLDEPEDTLKFEAGATDEFVLGSEEQLGEQPTIIRKKPLSGSDSDVRLVFNDDDDLSGSSQEIVLSGLGDSDSDVRLAPETTGGAGKGPGDVATSDSDIKIVKQSNKSSNRLGASDSDVRLVQPGDDDKSVLGEDSGLALDFGGDSGLALDIGGDSGISLADDESSLSLASDEESGLTLGEDSGIALHSPGDSGIALEGPKSGKKKKPGSKAADMGATQPMMPTMPNFDDDLDQTTMEVPMLDDGESMFELSTSAMDDDNAATNVIMLDDESPADEQGATMVKKRGPTPAVDLFADDEPTDGDEAMVAADDLYGEDDAVEEDIFGSGDEDFEEDMTTGESQADFAVPVQRVAVYEPEWGVDTLIGLSLAGVLMAATGLVMFDFVRTLWSGAEPIGPVTTLLDTFRGMFAS